MISSQAYIFETPLIEGVVIKCNSQFTMTIKAEGQYAKAHLSHHHKNWRY